MVENQGNYNVLMYDMCNNGSKRLTHNVGELRQAAFEMGMSLDITECIRVDSIQGTRRSNGERSPGRPGALELLEEGCQNYDAIIITNSGRQAADVTIAAELCLEQKGINYGKVIILGVINSPPYSAFPVASGNTYLNSKDAHSLVDKIREVANL